jgi:hypothetical protein
MAKEDKSKQEPWVPNKPPVESPIVEETKDSETKETPIVEEQEGEIKGLIFEQSGWCEDLKRGYRKGAYLPKSKKEYDALKPFAK